MIEIIPKVLGEGSKPLSLTSNPNVSKTTHSHIIGEEAKRKNSDIPRENKPIPITIANIFIQIKDKKILFVFFMVFFDKL